MLFQGQQVIVYTLAVTNCCQFEVLMAGQTIQEIETYVCPSSFELISIIQMYLQYTCGGECIQLLQTVFI